VSTRKKETSESQERPVRFYKIVALSFLCITIIVLGIIVFLSSTRATITITTKATPVQVNTVLSVNDPQATVGLRGTITSTVVIDKRSFNPTGTNTLNGTATGTVTLHDDSSQSQPLVATTRLLTTNGILFRLKNYETVPAHGAINVEVYADKKGASGDISASRFSIPGLDILRQKYVYATSDKAMSGGTLKVGIVSQDDITKAQKTLKEDSLQKGTKKLQNIFNGQVGVFTVGSILFSSSTNVGKQVSSFSLSSSSTVVGVFYSPDDLLQLMKKRLNNQAPNGSQTIETSKIPPAASIHSYDLAQKRAMLNVFYSGNAIINPESPALSKLMFYGKTTDEIRRYLLTLNHVYAVNVSLYPVWVQTIPHVPEHVRVIVKQVQ